MVRLRQFRPGQRGPEAAPRRAAADRDFPNYLLLSQPVLDALANHPRILDRVKYTANGAATSLTSRTWRGCSRLIRCWFGPHLPDVNEGQADSLTTSWPTTRCCLSARPGRGCACRPRLYLLLGKPWGSEVAGTVDGIGFHPGEEVLRTTARGARSGVHVAELHLARAAR